MATDADKKISLLTDDLASLENYIHDLFNFSPLPICFVSPIGVVLEVNPSFESLAKLKSYELIGEPIDKVFDKKGIEKLSKETLSQGFIEGREIAFFQKREKKIPVQAFTRVRRDEREEVVGYFLGLFDLTNIKEVEEGLREAKNTLEVKVEARTKELKRLTESLEEQVEQRTIQLQEKVKELEKFQKFAVGRETKMVELKKEIKALRDRIKVMER